MAIDTPETREITNEEANYALQDEILNGLKEVNDQLSGIGHGEAKRLLLASLSYPLLEEDFSSDSDAVKVAFSAIKRNIQAKAGLAGQIAREEFIDNLKKEVESQQGEKNV